MLMSHRRLNCAKWQWISWIWHWARKHEHCQYPGPWQVYAAQQSYNIQAVLSCWVGLKLLSDFNTDCNVQMIHIAADSCIFYLRHHSVMLQWLSFIIAQLIETKLQQWWMWSCSIWSACQQNISRYWSRPYNIWDEAQYQAYCQTQQLAG